MRRTKDEADQTRQNLLKAALTVFSVKGFESTRLEDIAAVAGVTRGAIYHHYGSKAELFKILVNQADQQGNQVVSRAIAEGGSFSEIAQRVLVYSMELLADDPHFREVMSLLLFKTAGAAELGNLPLQRYEESKAQIEAIAGFFSAGLEQSQVRSTLDPLIAARAFLSYQNGLIFFWLANPQAFSIKADARALADIFIHGIAP